MSVFVDTGLFYALQNTRATNHRAARRALATAIGGHFGQPYTSEYVYDETVTLVRSRGGYREAKRAGDRILGAGEFPPSFDLLPVTREDFEQARAAFETYHDHALSFTDATTVALMDAHRIDVLLSFDDDFDGVVDRLDPADLEMEDS